MCSSWADLAEYACPQLRRSLERWERLAADIKAAQGCLAKGRRFLTSNLLWQSIVGRSLTIAAMNSVMGMARWSENDLETAAGLFTEAML